MNAQVRNYLIRYGRVIRNSIAMVCFILAYVAYFALLGYRIFNTDIEGIQNFFSYAESFWTMFILLTTANFPDVMLSTYK
jgi:two pore calcium channel protein 1